MSSHRATMTVTCSVLALTLIAHQHSVVGLRNDDNNDPFLLETRVACEESPPPENRNDGGTVITTCFTCPNGYFARGNYCFCDDEGTAYCAKLKPDPPIPELSRCLPGPPSSNDDGDDTPVDCTVCETGYFDGCNHCTCSGTSTGMCTKRSCSAGSIGGGICLDPPEETSAPSVVPTPAPTAAPTSVIPECILDDDAAGPLESFETTFWLEYIGPSGEFLPEENEVIDPILQEQYNEIVSCDTSIYTENLTWVAALFFEGDDVEEDPLGGQRRLQRTSRGTSRLSNQYSVSGRCRGCTRNLRLFNDVDRRRLFSQALRRQPRNLQSSTDMYTTSVVVELNNAGFTEIQSVSVLDGDPTPFPTISPSSSPTPYPTVAPTTRAPLPVIKVGTPRPTPVPSSTPSTSISPSSAPSVLPTVSILPTIEPSSEPSDVVPRNDFVIVIRPQNKGG